MPKKKILHKGKPKSSTEESEDFIFKKKLDENVEEDYTTVVDFESNKKYNKRLITNNWAKYESTLTDFECSDNTNQPPKTDDFNYLLETASSDCSHFQFSSEKQWSNENAVPASEIFNLDLSVLSNGLACVPFYERIGLDESHLSVEDKERFDRAAEESLKEYNLIREKGKKDVGEQYKKSLEENVKAEEDSAVGNGKDKNEEKLEEIQRTNDDDKVPGGKKKLFFSEKEENLEDWLDSVLDD